MALDTPVLLPPGSTRVMMFIIGAIYIIITIAEITSDSMDLAKAINLFCYKRNATCRFGSDLNSMRLTKWAATVTLHEIVMITSCMPVVAEIQKCPKMLRCWAIFIPFSIVAQFIRAIQVGDDDSGPILHYSQCGYVACSSVLTATGAIVIALILLMNILARHDEMVLEKTLAKREPSPDIIRTRSSNTGRRSNAADTTIPNIVSSTSRRGPICTGFRNPVYLQDFPSLLHPAPTHADFFGVDLEKNNSRGFGERE